MIAFAGAPSSPDDIPEFSELDDAFCEKLFTANPDSFELSELAELAEAALGIDLPAQLKWQPRKDQPERYDQQTGFYNCPSRGVVWLLGGNGAGCLGAEQEVYDPVANQSRKVSEIGRPFHVWARTASGEAVIAKASRPRVYGKEDLYRVTLSNGRSVLVTLGHRVLAGSGDWREIGDIVQSARVSNLPPSSVGRKSQYPASECVKQCDDHTEGSKQSDLSKVLLCTSEQSGELANSLPNCARRVSQSLHGRALSFVRLKNNRLSFRGYGWHSSNRPSGSRGHCSPGLRLCDEQPLRASGIGQVSVQQSVGADEHSPSLSRMDDLACAPERTLDGPEQLHRTMNRSDFPGLQSSEAQCASLSAYSPFSGAADTPIQNDEPNGPATHQNSAYPRFLGVSYLIDTTESLIQSATVSSVSCFAPLVEMNDVATYVTSIAFVRHDEYWDFSVDEYENYWMEGAWHHNTTETTMAKVAKFVLNTPAPRKDTPFWVIGGSYEQSMETCWKEKLYGHGHILDDDIDWDRVAWYRPKQQLPFRVPLLPTYCQADRELFRRLIPEQFPYDPRGNWSLEFKSWRQGADQMMARSIGGFAFVEQFPWGVFTEVLRGCREYNLPGSKMVEYTPVDPDLSGDIEEMIQNGKRPKSEGEDGKPEKITLRSNMKFLPDDWEVFHANTECAMEAGHVSKEWFDEYFGMIPKESLGMRLKGLFAAFEGVIYKSFDPTVHVVGDEIFDWILSGNCSHRRAIDWGAGPQNAFVCLWGARNRLSQWFIYDELYSTDQDKTTVDHLIDVCQRHPWPNQPWYGTTYADPASPGNIRLAQQLGRMTKMAGLDIPNINMSMARNAVIEGIEHVQWLLKRSIPEWNEFTESMIQRPRLFIHYSCVNLIREIKKYRWVKSDGANGQSLNPLNPRPEPLKFDDHCCFAAGTLVSMADGSHKRIEDIRVGDRVLSHLGIADVQAAGCTGIKETVTITHENGTIDCTALHPFYHDDTKDYRSVSVGDVTCRLQGWSADTVSQLRLSSGAGSIGGDIQSRDITLCGTISGGRRESARRANSTISGCIRRFGNLHMVASRLDAIFTTKTKTQRTIRLRTWNAYQSLSTRNFIVKTLSRLASLPNIGTQAMTGERGTQNTLRNHLQRELQKPEPVNRAGMNFKLLTEKRLQGFAATTAKWQPEESGKPTTPNDHVPSVDRHSWPENTRRLLPVQTPVEVSRCLSVQKKDGVEKVYNLTTSDGTVFVNGLLAKQCDALRYLTFSDDSQLGLTIESARSNSKAAQSVAKSNGNWRDLLAGGGMETSFGGRYGRGKKKNQEEENY